MTSEGGSPPARPPLWLTSTVRYCSRCATELTFGPVAGEDRDRLACTACGFVAYLNPRLVVIALPVTDSGEIVLLRRAIEPGYGRWAPPGGFLEIDETAQQGAVRETMEETGLIIETTRLVGLYSRPQAAVVVAAWEARIVGGSAHPTAESLEVRLFRPADVPWPQIAFQTSTWALRDLLRQRHADHSASDTELEGQVDYPDDSA